MAQLTQSLDSYQHLPVVNRVPSELLGHIFWICSRWKYDPVLTNRLSWTQVCHRWRSVALNFPLLWNDIDLSHRQVNLTRQFLDLSRNTTIAINNRSSSNRISFPVHEVVSRGQTISHIDLQLNYVAVLELFSTLTSTSITHLSLKSPNFRDPSVPQCLQITLPNLRFLSLDRIPIAWHTASLNNLNHLSIKGLPKSRMASPSQLHRILLHSPHIEYVYIIGNQFPDTDETSTEVGGCGGDYDTANPPQFALRNLKEFSLAAPTRVISFITRCLAIPRAVELSFFVSGTSSDSVSSFSELEGPSWLEEDDSPGGPDWSHMTLRLDEGSFSLFPQSTRWDPEVVGWSPIYPQYQTTVTFPRLASKTKKQIPFLSMIDSVHSFVDPFLIRDLEVDLGAFEGTQESELYAYISRFQSLESISIVPTHYTPPVQCANSEALSILLDIISEAKATPSLMKLVIGKPSCPWYDCKNDLPALSLALRRRALMIGAKLPELLVYSCFGLEGTDSSHSLDDIRENVSVVIIN
ncbi:hypothetical protein CC1G_06126 [Coprinopsis cinerea okayama7|uniref:Uncharacterized protein n=1 Tax=Coprinopsis cinerea (strain Okayama-7 / 130 / ATCC MYA-4618 / FGSC 9003) TaxID=240176 RepID=A8PA93_COPC7|nr:hypothetical protein CC1G_06126 [Coprinopsis cinerea okayama7\|eukprot:XP_001839936.2 hypothetical protein CC1G_06126 [Coprinopsis cinerea okayama7\